MIMEVTIRIGGRDSMVPAVAKQIRESLLKMLDGDSLAMVSARMAGLTFTVPEMVEVMKP